MKPINKQNLIYTLILFIVILQSRFVCADEVLLKDMIQHALMENSDILQLETQIQSLERDLQLIKAGQNWQVKLNLNTAYQSVPQNPGNKDSEVSGDLKISIDKTYPYGITIRPDLSIDENLEPVANFRVDKQLYPFVPTDAEKSSFKIEQDLLKAKERLQVEKTGKIIQWVEDYLNILRLQEKYEITKSKRELAEHNLNQVLAKKQIGEANEQQVLSAQLEVKQLDYELKNSEVKLIDSRTGLSRELALPDGQIITVHDTTYIDELMASVESTKTLDLDQQFILVQENNYQLLINRLDRKVMEQEIIWSNEDKKTTVNLNGSYNSKTEDYTIGITVSYQLYDSGQFTLKAEEKAEQLKQKTEEYANLLTSLQTELEKLNLQVELNKMTLEMETQKVTKALLDEEIASQQYEIGYIDQDELQNVQIKRLEAEISLRTAQDQLLLSQLRLNDFLQLFE